MHWMKIERRIWMDYVQGEMIMEEDHGEVHHSNVC